MKYDKLYNYIKYSGVIVGAVPLFILFHYPIKFIVYIIGFTVNVTINYLIKIKEKKINPFYKNKKVEKYRFYEYDLYGYPSEKIQNIGYSVGFLGAYLAQDRKSMNDYEKKVIRYMIIAFYIIFAVVMIILSLSSHSTFQQMIAGKIIGLIVGVVFFKLSEPIKSLQNVY